MRSVTIIAAALSLAAGTAFAQYGAAPGGTPRPPAQSEPAPSVAARSTLPNAVGALTEIQAKSRIEAEGYTRVSELKRDSTGAWNAKAMKDGKPVQISLDTAGHIIQLN